MSGLASRLARLERAHPGPDLKAIRQRCAAGTASIDEMAIVLGDAPDRHLHEGVVPHAARAIEQAFSGGRVPRIDLVVCAYPPDWELPENVQAALHYLTWTATYSQKDLKRQVFGLSTVHRFNPAVRLQAATVLLALGHEGERARSIVWERDADGDWRTSATALASECAGVGRCCGAEAHNWDLIPPFLYYSG